MIAISKQFSQNHMNKTIIYEHNSIEVLLQQHNTFRHSTLVNGSMIYYYK
jgi:hypothetical protein